MRLPAMIFVMAALGCSGGGSAPSSSSSGDDAATLEDVGEDVVAVADTGAGACGNKVGDVLCDLDLEGYVRDGVADGLATAAPYAATKLSDVFATGKQKYVFLWTSAYW